MDDGINNLENQAAENQKVETQNVESGVNNNDQVNNNYEVPPTENQNVEPPKKNNTLVIILVILVIGLVGYIIYSQVINKEEPPKNEGTPSNEVQNGGTTNTGVSKSYVGDWGTTIYALHLREDGSFDLVSETTENVGTYDISDNKITLTITVQYGSDICYNKLDKPLVETGTITNDNTMALTIFEENYTFKKGTASPESKDSLSRYVINPVDGETPAGWADPWVACP